MGKFIYYIIQNCVFISYGISFGAAWIFRNHPLLPNYLKDFFLYPLIGCLVGLIFELKSFSIISIRLYFAIIHCSVLFYFLFLSLLLHKLLGRKRIFIGLIFLVSLILSTIITIDILYFSSYSSAVANSFLLIFCIYYFFYLFKNPTIPVLFRHPGFIICCGILIGSSLIIPFAFLNKYLISLHVSKDSLYLIGSLAVISHLIMNLFFIKAFLCIRHLRK